MFATSMNNFYLLKPPMASKTRFRAEINSPTVLMMTQYLELAALVVPNEQLLINLVSQRVKQLNQGHRPLVETLPRMPASVIALKEIAEGKITYTAPESAF